MVKSPPLSARSPARSWVQKLKLKPHPEGGFFRETYRSAGTSVFHGFTGPRNHSTAIFFLLPKGHRSRLHRIKSDEVWHFYAGGPILIMELTPKGKVIRTRLGPRVQHGDKLQHVVPAGHWFGAVPAPGTSFSLVGCTVAPGFDFHDFEMATQDSLLKKFPHARKTIRLLA